MNSSPPLHVNPLDRDPNSPKVPQVRAALDFGSGSIKILVSCMDGNASLGKPLWQSVVPILMTDEVARHAGSISVKLEELALTIFKEMKAQTLERARQNGYFNIEFSGVATAVFRQAPNGQALLETIHRHLQIPLRILSQDEEGEIGFLTAQILYPKTPIAHLVAWDSGNGSFQITARRSGGHFVYPGSLGHGQVRLMLAQKIRSHPPLLGHESGNPLTAQEAEQLSILIKEALCPVDPWMKKLINAEPTLIAAIGDPDSIFAVALAACQLNVNSTIDYPISLEFEAIERAFYALLGHSDEQLRAKQLPIKTPTALLFLLSVMRHMEIERFHFTPSAGTTPGLLICSRFWNFPIT